MKMFSSKYDAEYGLYNCSKCNFVVREFINMQIVHPSASSLVQN